MNPQPPLEHHFYLPFEKREGFSYSHEAIEQLSEYEKYQLSFHPERPRFLDYLTVFNNTEACLENNEHGSCIIQTHRATLQGLDGKLVPVMLIGQQSAPTSNFELLRKLMQNPEAIAEWNQGMPTPAAFEKAIQAIALAEAEGRLIMTVIDTAGADPTEQSEGGGIAWKIGRCMQALAEAKVPTLSVIINRGCSGGAIALTGCDAVLAMEYATYMVISPEACSSILFRTRDQAGRAAEISQITAREGLKHGIIDALITEPEGPAHRFREAALQSFKNVVSEWTSQLSRRSAHEIQEKRIERWAAIGQWDEISEEAIQCFEKKRTGWLPAPNEGLFVARHRRCRDHANKQVIDPVLYRKLVADNFVCETCGHRYTRLTIHDYLALLVDDGSFSEHPETRYIVDRDILNFPDYRQKITEAQQKCGIASSVITGNGTVEGNNVVLCATSFAFLGGSFCMSTAEKIWRASALAIERRVPLIIQATGGGARMHEGCSSMVGLPKVHVALSRVEQAGLPVITVVTDPTLGGVAIGVGSRGIRLFEHNAGNIGFSGKRVIEQYTGKPTSKDFQTTWWLQQKGFVQHTARPQEMKTAIGKIIEEVRR